MTETECKNIDFTHLDMASDDFENISNDILVNMNNIFIGIHHETNQIQTTKLYHTIVTAELIAFMKQINALTRKNIGVIEFTHILNRNAIHYMMNEYNTNINELLIPVFDNMNNIFRQKPMKIKKINIAKATTDFVSAELLAMYVQFKSCTGQDVDLLGFTYILNKLAIRYVHAQIKR